MILRGPTSILYDIVQHVLMSAGLLLLLLQAVVAFQKRKLADPLVDEWAKLQVGMVTGQQLPGNGCCTHVACLLELLHQ